MGKFTPTWHSKTIFEIPMSFYVNNGFKYVFTDLDNTLDAFDVLTPSNEAKNLKMELEENKIELIIISNNKSGRVKNYAKDLGVRCLHSAGKPFKSKLLKFLKVNNINKNNVIMIGDQTVTDICCANNAKIKNVLVDKLVERDQPTTKFNRFFDKRIRKSLIKKNLLRAIEKE